MFGGEAADWAGKGDAGVVEAALAASTVKSTDPLVLLSAFGGRDLAGLAGAIAAACHQSTPVVLGGLEACAAAAVLHAVEPASVAHCLAGEAGGPAQSRLLECIGLAPVLNVGTIGDTDGSIDSTTGAALALSLLKSAAAGLDTL